jgi:hypothetical protein
MNKVKIDGYNGQFDSPRFNKLVANAIEAIEQAMAKGEIKSFFIVPDGKENSPYEESVIAYLPKGDETKIQEFSLEDCVFAVPVRDKVVFDDNNRNSLFANQFIGIKKGENGWDYVDYEHNQSKYETINTVLKRNQELNVLSTQPDDLNAKINRLKAVANLNLEQVLDSDTRGLMMDMIKKSANSGNNENTSYTYGGFDPIGSVSASIVKTDNGYTVSGERKAFHETNSTKYIVHLDKDFKQVDVEKPKEKLG